MPRARPAGFTFLTVCALLCACGMAWVLAKLGDDALPDRFAVAATGALALVTAEALAFVRPWVFGAALALAGSFVLMLFVTVDQVDDFLAAASLVTLPILIALALVYNGVRSAHAHGPPPARIPVP